MQSGLNMAASSYKPYVSLLSNVLKFAMTLVAVAIVTEYVRATAEEFTDYLLCRRCGHSVARAVHILNIPCRMAIRERNDTLSGKKDVLIQRFTNADGQQFELITTAVAAVKEIEEISAVMTWFEGYTWQVALCPHCRQQVGWTYRLDEGGTTLQAPGKFYGLILDNLLEQKEAEDIISQPKFRSYGS